jgi:hypothetical protein
MLNENKIGIKILKANFFRLEKLTQCGETINGKIHEITSKGKDFKDAKPYSKYTKTAFVKIIIVPINLPPYKIDE